MIFFTVIHLLTDMGKVWIFQGVFPTEKYLRAYTCTCSVVQEYPVLEMNTCSLHINKHQNTLRCICPRGFMHRAWFRIMLHNFSKFLEHFKAVFLDFIPNLHNLLLFLDCLHNHGKFGANLYNLNLKKKGRIIIFFFLHKTAGTGICTLR